MDWAWDNFDFTKVRWDAIPSCNAIIPNGKPVTWSIITKDEPVVLATDLHEQVAKFIINSHNVRFM